MFKLIVLNTEADWAEETLIRLNRTFTKRKGKHITVFFNNTPASRSLITNINSYYLGTGFMRAFKTMPMFIKNDVSKAHQIITPEGEYTSDIADHDHSWKTQSERYAKIKLYQLANIPRQDWIL